jgi:hypothetical protein
MQQFHSYAPAEARPVAEQNDSSSGIHQQSERAASDQAVINHQGLIPSAGVRMLVPATPLCTGGKGPVTKRRFQRGCFQMKGGLAYTFYYEDCERADGSLASRKVRHYIGHVGPGGISERAARREHSRIMEEVNRKRGSIAPAMPGRAFADSVVDWRKAIAPLLSPATVRQRESYLRKHILPKFKDAAPHTLDVGTMQQFVTELRRTLSRKTVAVEKVFVNANGTVAATSI